jgi:hypothetical protein
MADRFCTQGWNFSLKDGTRRLAAWKNCSRSGSASAVFGSSVPIIHCKFGGSLLERISRTGKFDTELLDASPARKDCPNLQVILASIQSAWNYQKRFTVSGSRGGFSSVFLVDSHPSVQNSILECKKRQPLS